MRRLKYLAWILAFLGLTAALGAGAWFMSYRNGMDRLAEQGRADLDLAADRLTSQLLRYRELAVILSSHPELKALLSGEGNRGDGDRLVRAMADKTGALSLDLVDPAGAVLASSSSTPRYFDPVEPPLARALSGALGTAHRIIPRADAGQTRAFVFAAPVHAPSGPAVGAVVASVDVRKIEGNWPGNAPAAFFTDDRGLVFASNRSELLLTRRGGGGNFPGYTVGHVLGNEVWRLDGGPYLPRRALHIERPLPVIGMTAHALLDARPVFRNALLVCAATMALLLAIGAALLVAAQQRLALSARLEAEAAATARLESRVVERTRELASANRDLRREIGERKEAEAALKRAQDELVQAGKLSALGEMSAGISHELNQPLMAIRSFAENGEAFLERGNPEKARANLARIAELARRAGRIIQNLRAFAKQEQGRVTDVDLGAVVDDALEMTAEKIARGAVILDWSRPGTPAMVRGGAVRLQQVVVNLITNAVDAMADLPDGAPRRVTIELDPMSDSLRLTVADTGPGLAEPDRVFDPFYSTKAVGAAEGMGLGLSISYGLVQSFGGSLRAANRPGGGAVLTMKLPRGQQREAAE